MPKRQENCGNCRYFEEAAPRVGQCRRFPTPSRKTVGDWCGEFDPTPEAAAAKKAPAKAPAKK